MNFKKYKEQVNKGKKEEGSRERADDTWSDSIINI